MEGGRRKGESGREGCEFGIRNSEFGSDYLTFAIRHSTFHIIRRELTDE
jgi:hypothetical protein